MIIQPNLPLNSTLEPEKNKSFSGQIIFKAEDSNIEVLRYVNNQQFEELKSLLNYQDGQFLIAKENVAVKKTSYKTVQCCVYTAVSNYLKAFLGIDLSHEDKKWYSNQPEVESAGLKENSALSVVSKLVFPYGVGIKRVYVKKGRILSGDWSTWVGVLGCNLLALNDCNTSNEEFILQFPEESREAARSLLDKCNLEFVEELPRKGLVVFQNGVSGNHALGGGHCTFKSPREFKGNFSYALELDRLENCHYLQDPVLGDCFAEAQALELDLNNCKGLDGKKLGDTVFNYTPSSFKNSHITYGNPTNYFKDDRPTSSITLDWIASIRRENKSFLAFLKKFSLNLDDYPDFELDLNLGKVDSYAAKYERSPNKHFFKADDFLDFTLFEIYTLYNTLKPSGKKMLTDFLDQNLSLLEVSSVEDKGYDEMILDNYKEFCKEFDIPVAYLAKDAKPNEKLVSLILENISKDEKISESDFNKLTNQLRLATYLDLSCVYYELKNLKVNNSHDFMSFLLEASKINGTSGLKVQ